MDFTTAVILGFIVILMISWIFREINCIHYDTRCSLKGPKGLPIFGSLFPLLKSYKAPMKQYTKWAEEFGPFYKVKVGSQLAVVVSDASYFNKVFAKTGNKLNFRVRGNVLSAAMGNKGIATSDGKVWLDHRRFSTKAFRDLNVGRSATEEGIFSQVTKLIDRVKDKCKASREGKYNKTEVDLTVSVFSILWQFVTGTKIISLDDSSLRKMLCGTRAQLKAAEQSGGWNYYFILQILWIISSNPLKLLPSYIRRVVFVKNELNRQKEIFGKKSQEESGPSLVQLYLEEIANNLEAGSSLSERQLEVFMSDFIVAGVESLTSAIRWTLLYLAAFPDCMEKLRKEVDENLKKSSLLKVASYSNRQELPYLEAVIAESLRIRPTIHTIVHVTHEDIVIAEEFIPKETWIIGNIWGAHHNSQVWNDPEVFRPERFLNSDGQICRDQLDKCVTFSTGPRRCLGEQLSRMELHAFVAGIISELDVTIDPDKVNSFTFEPEVTLSLVPKDDFLMFRPRQKML